MVTFVIADTSYAAEPDRAVDYDRSVVFVMYHRFGEDRYPATNIRLDQFKAHIEELKEGRYNVMPLEAIIKALRAGTSLPDKTIGITIDDAYLSVYEEAFPLLKAAHLPFTLFVTTGNIGDTPTSYMSWKQVNEMAQSKLVTIGNHLASHVSALEMSESEIKQEMSRAQSKIRQKTGKSPALFSFPYGEYSNKAVELVETAGFQAAFGQQSGAVDSNADLFRLPRYALSENFGNIDRFRLVINSLPLPVYDVTPEDTLIKEEENPPLYGFTVHRQLKNLKNLKCYASAGGELTQEQIGSSRFEIRLAEALPKGRHRINCTLLDPSGRWRWFGTQFYIE